MRYGGRLALVALVLAGFAAPRAIAQQIDPELYQQLRWRMIGPFRGGRTRAVAGVPGEPNVFAPFLAIRMGPMRNEEFSIPPMAAKPGRGFCIRTKTREVRTFKSIP